MQMRDLFFEGLDKLSKHFKTEIAKQTFEMAEDDEHAIVTTPDFHELLHTMQISPETVSCWDDFQAAAQ
jgi:hypothetical protein